VIEPGTLVASRYRLDERVAVEQHGEAWRAVDAVLGHPYTVWCRLTPFSFPERFEERLWPNVRAVATVNHPRLVHILDYGSESSVGSYVVTERPDAQPLSQILAEIGRLPARETFTVLAGVAEGLQALHSAGMVHCHVRPATIQVCPDGTGLLSGLHLSALGREALPAGPTTYLTPEQAKGDAVSIQADIYALGLVAYTCLAGRPPFEHEDRLYVALMHVREQPPPLPSDIPAPARAIVERALAKDPYARPGAADFAEAARRVSG
jgi:serine/threonine-protein kinase